MEPGGRVAEGSLVPVGVAECRAQGTLASSACVDTSFLFEMSWPACSQIAKDKLVSRVPSICSVLTKCAP